MKYNKLTVLKEADFNKKRRYVVFVCRCDCGKTLEVSENSLKSGRRKSCGCFSRGAARRTHGSSRPHSKTYSEYQVWKAMKRRCHYKKDKHYQDYGGRGITICERWLKFENFIKDMGTCPEGKSLDRINNSGIYEPSNCRWATTSEQQSNKRNAVLLTLKGQTKNLSHWAKETGIERRTISARLRYGWTVEKALTAKVGGTP
jgi:hypothetical protein